MAKCNYCGREMITADGCTYTKVQIDDQIYDRVKVGQNKDDYYYNQINARCGDCGAKYGHYHHPNCDIEVSPVDGTQLISNPVEYLP